ncbi:hypothetical protein D3C86_1068410 [compost metagenome]|jgi:hypothetical protein
MYVRQRIVKAMVRLKAGVKRAGAKAQHQGGRDASEVDLAAHADCRRDYACNRNRGQNKRPRQFRKALHPRRATHEGQAKTTTGDVPLLKAGA